MIDPEILFADASRRECHKVAQAIVDEIQLNPNTPRITGKMAEGYRVVDDEDGSSIVNDVDYWIYVEMGTRYQNAQPHVRPAIEVVRARYGE